MVTSRDANIASAILQYYTIDRWHVQHSVMVNVTWRHFDQSAKQLAQLIVGHATNTVELIKNHYEQCTGCNAKQWNIVGLWCWTSRAVGDLCLRLFVVCLYISLGAGCLGGLLWLLLWAIVHSPPLSMILVALCLGYTISSVIFLTTPLSKFINSIIVIIVIIVGHSV